MDTKSLIFELVLKVGLSASLAALLARSNTFRQVLFTEERDSDMKVRLLLFLTPALAVGTMLRLVGYRFADLTLEGSFLLGLLGGRVVGPLGGAIISLPGFSNGEWLITPVACAAGLLGGLIRQVLPNKESIWNFGPFTFLSIPRRLIIRFRDPNALWDLLPLVACILLEMGRLTLGHAVPSSRWLSFLDAQGWPQQIMVVLATVMSVAVPLKIWNNTRIERKLEQNQQLLLNARMDALTSQIQPHFLFNTLNAVSSLIRFDPDTARGVVLKLSNILRRLLRKQENFVPLRDELEFVDDYLDIEVARFGRDKLQIFKEIEEQSLEAFVPSMLLQPIVENSIRHGLSPRLHGGEIHIRTFQRDGRLVLEVEDNGIGIPEKRLPEVGVYPEAAGRGTHGIGISNVQERLKVLYGQDFRLDIKSQPGVGTLIRIEIPELVSVLESSS